MLQKLRNVDLQINIYKREFHVQEILFLSLLMSTEELRMDFNKI
jgi:hypothetical protein